jgi:hypothetical protein
LVSAFQKADNIFSLDPDMRRLLTYCPDACYDLYLIPPSWTDESTLPAGTVPVFRIQRGQLYKVQDMCTEFPEMGLVGRVEYRQGSFRHPLYFSFFNTPLGDIRGGIFTDLYENRFLLKVSPNA